MPLIGIGTGRGLIYSPPVAAATTTTWNPSDKASQITLSNGNLTATANATGTDAGARTVASTSTAKVYWEMTVNLRSSAAGNFSASGVSNSTWAMTFIGASGSAGATAASPLYGTGDVVSCALDATTRRFWYRVNGGSWVPSGDPAAGTGGQDVSGVTGALFPAFFMKTTGDQITANFGATAYSQTPPSGFGNW